MFSSAAGNTKIDVPLNVFWSEKKQADTKNMAQYAVHDHRHAYSLYVWDLSERLVIEK